jgi:cell division protein FtsQ
VGKVRERLDIPKFWWRSADRAPARPNARQVEQPQRPAQRLREPEASFEVTPDAASRQAPSSDGPGSWMPATFVVALLFGTAAFIAVSRIVPLPASGPLSAQIDDLMIMAGLGVDEIHVSGHRYTIDGNIFAALELDRPTSLLRYSPEAARRRVEALSWVSRATVTRVLPNTVEIVISERTPIAVWLKGDGAILVDAEGRELAAVSPSTLPQLPRISGAGAPVAVSALVAALRDHPAIARRVAVSERVGLRRWTLDLDNGSRVHLPAEGEAAALTRLMQRAESSALLSEPRRIVDLRVEDRIAIAPRGGALAPSAGPVPASTAVPRKSASAL